MARKTNGPDVVSPLVGLSAEQLHENVAATVTKAMQRRFPQVEVRFQDLTISADLSCHRHRLPGRIKTLPESKKILNNVSGVFRPRTITLVLGQPGSGKSALMKILSGRFPLAHGVKMTGDVTFNGRSRQELLPRLPQFVAYVDQRDRHLPMLTVKETLEFAHACNGGGVLSNLEKEFLYKGNEEDAKAAIQLAEEASKVMPQIIVQHLGLSTCKDTIVGDAMHRGVSGGQRKRVTTGEMLFGMKNVLIMDEISTGLDSASTFDIVKSQRSAAKALEKTIVISLLQPSPEVFALFDEVLVLNEGEIIYHGPRDRVLEHFESLGLVCPPRRDTADFLLDLGTPDQITYHESGRGSGIPTTPQQLGEAFKQSSIFKANYGALTSPVSEHLIKDMAEYLDSKRAFKQSFFANLHTLLQREFRVTARNTAFIRGRIMMVIIMGLLNGTLFYQFDPTSVQVVMGTIFGTVLFVSMGQLSEIPTFYAGRDVFYKQRGANFLRSSAYVLSFMMSKVPMAIAETIVFGSLMYWLCGFVNDAAAFLLFEALLFLASLAFTSFFFFMSSICPEMHVAKPLSIVCIGVFIIFAGFIVSKEKIPDYLIWIYWLDPVAWCIRGLAVNQYKNAEFNKCTYRNIDYCAISGGKTMGEYYLSLYGVPTDSMWMPLSLLYMAGMTAFCMTAATLAFEYKRFEHHSSGATVTVTSTDVHQQLEKLRSQSSSNRVVPVGHQAYTVPPVTLAFKDLWYSVPNPSKKGETLDLLKGVTGYASPGTMTALMGSSGAGKTTLMDVIAGRKTGGKIRGQILLNGHPTTKKVIQRCTGYCEQMDIHCESATIREAITFSAFLRQPKEVSDKEKQATVKEVLNLLDLHPIADNQIHGRSTEQLKRVTIAVELAAKPSVLFLDEPTSGLDARSAKAIMEGVRKVANSGRTIICTIHQPSSEVFFVFDRLLLLKTGGQTVFHGNVGKNCVDLIDYFQSIEGVKAIDTGYNPATWMLECIGAGVGNTAQRDFAAVFHESELRKNLDLEMARPGIIAPAEGTHPVSFSSRYAASHMIQMKLVLTRFLVMYWRTKSYTLTALIMAIVLALLFGGIFSGSEYVSYQGINSGVGMIFVSSLFLGVISFNSAIPLASEERVVYYREQASQMYHPFWYFVGSTVSEIPFVTSRTIVFTAIFFPFVGFTGFDTAVVFWIQLLLIVLLLTYLGQLFAYAMPNMETAMLGGVLFTSSTSNFMGFNPPAFAIPKPYKWIYHIVPQRYALSNLVASVFGDCANADGVQIGCYLLEHAPRELSKLTVRAYVEMIFNMKHDNITRNIFILIGAIGAFRLLALLSLLYINHQKR